MINTVPLFVKTLSDLQNLHVDDDLVVFVEGKTTVGDGLGGFYRWDAGRSGAADTYNNVVLSNTSGSGR